jgi:hypothetical protein
MCEYAGMMIWIGSVWLRIEFNFGTEYYIYHIFLQLILDFKHSVIVFILNSVEGL